MRASDFQGARRALVESFYRELRKVQEDLTSEQVLGLLKAAEGMAMGEPWRYTREVLREHGFDANQATDIANIAHGRV